MAPCGGSGEGAADIEDISSPRTQVHKDIQLLSPYLIRYGTCAIPIVLIFFDV